MRISEVTPKYKQHEEMAVKILSMSKESPDAVVKYLNLEMPKPEKEAVDLLRSCFAKNSEKGKIGFYPMIGGWTKLGRLNVEIEIAPDSLAIADANTDEWLNTILETAMENGDHVRGAPFKIQVSTMAMLTSMSSFHMLGDINIQKIITEDKREFEVDSFAKIIKAREAGRTMPVMAEQIMSLMRGPGAPVKGHEEMSGVTVVYSRSNAHAIPDSQCKQWLKDQLDKDVKTIYVATECQLNEVRLAIRMGELGLSKFDFDGKEFEIGLKGETEEEHNAFPLLGESVRFREVAGKIIKELESENPLEFKLKKDLVVIFEKLNKLDASSDSEIEAIKEELNKLPLQSLDDEHPFNARTVLIKSLDSLTSEKEDGISHDLEWSKRFFERSISYLYPQDADNEHSM